jgi:DNA-binding winged helix-turn-helix (wHTH) protein
VLPYGVGSESVESSSPPRLVRFGTFELDSEAGLLLMDGRPVRLPPQPFKLLWLLASHHGQLLTRDQIREALWGGETFIDFDQGVNFAIKQVREALKDDAERPLYIQTVPKRGYRFIAPVEVPQVGTSAPRGTDLNLQKVLWTNIAELRLAEAQRRARVALMVKAGAIAAALLIVLSLLWELR